MTAVRTWVMIAALVVFGIAHAGAQGPAPEEVRNFIGTWLVDMAYPQNTQETIKIWDDSGAINASVQINQFPSRKATRVIKDGEMLVLSVSRNAEPPIIENGIPMWVVIVLTLEGGTMKLAQLTEVNRIPYRGTGRKVSD